MVPISCRLNNCSFVSSKWKLVVCSGCLVWKHRTVLLQRWLNEQSPVAQREWGWRGRGPPWNKLAKIFTGVLYRFLTVRKKPAIDDWSHHWLVPPEQYSWLRYWQSPTLSSKALARCGRLTMSDLCWDASTYTNVVRRIRFLLCLKLSRCFLHVAHRFLLKLLIWSLGEEFSIILFTLLCMFPARNCRLARIRAVLRFSTKSCHHSAPKCHRFRQLRFDDYRCKLAIRIFYILQQATFRKVQTIGRTKATVQIFSRKNRKQREKCFLTWPSSWRSKSTSRSMRCARLSLDRKLNKQSFLSGKSFFFSPGDAPRLRNSSDTGSADTEWSSVYVNPVSHSSGFPFINRGTLHR